MKKIIVLLLTIAVILNLTACGKKKADLDTISDSNNGQNETTNTNDSNNQNIESNIVEESTSYNFKGYTETADWPGKDMWESYGLPEILMSDDVNGSVHISDKDWIYPLNGKDGIMIEARPSSSQIASVIDTLKNAGIEMKEDPNYELGYTGYYDNSGNDMKITVSETGLGKLTITIIVSPTD